MKLLYYNWDKVEGKIGGGVGIYQRNLIKYLLKNTEHEVYVLSSGFTYTNDNGNKPEIRKIDNEISESIKSFEIVNSPVMAPAQQSIKNLRHYIEDTQLYEILKDFINSVGGFDVIHFNNLEGLSINVLKLKELFPKTKFIFSVHNYFLVCSKVSLWQLEKNGASHNCTKKTCDECFYCYTQIKYGVEIFSRRYLKKMQFKGVGRSKWLYSRLFPDVDDLSLYDKFEKENLKCGNKYFDSILAVSNRVREIITSKGFDENKVITSYIGTDVAEIQSNVNCADINSNPFKIIYMSYMNVEKGFFFFLKSLQEMPEDLAKNIVVTVVSGYGLRNLMDVRNLKKLKNKFKDVILKNGYKREEQKGMLQGQHLGMIPVMWEDNLPQTAMEQIAYGVPILCSNLGGAAELHSHNPNFTFEAGNVNEFLNKLTNIYNNRNLLKDYWKTVKPLTTMKEHVKFLEQIYTS